MIKKQKTTKFSIFKSKVDKIIDSNRKTIILLILAFIFLFITTFVSSFLSSLIFFIL